MDYISSFLSQACLAQWAYPDNKLDRFKRLLEHGADPNVVIESRFNTHGGMQPRDSVTHMACKTSFPGYFEAAFANGGDPSLIRKVPGIDETPIFTVIRGSTPNKLAKIRTLVEKGANINYLNGSGFTPSMTAVGYGGQYDIALELMKMGADPNVYSEGDNSKLIHMLVGDRMSKKSTWSPKKQAEFEALLKWLIEHGQSLEQAKADRERWKSWSATTGEHGRKMAAKVAARKAREARKKAAAQKNPEKQAK